MKLNDMKLKASFVTVGLLATGLAFAEEEKMPAKPGVSELVEIMGAAGISVTGYVDLSYTYLSGKGTFNNSVPNRVFDRERNSFNLQTIDLTVSSLPTEGFGGLVNLNFGPDADVIAPAGTDASDQFDVQAAYLHYASGPLMVIAGKYVTLSGAEVIKSPANANFSRSILFGYAIPFSHTGLRATYTVSDRLSLFAGINNGWDVLKESASVAADGDIADGKTVELGLITTPIQPLSIAASAYIGDEPGAAVGQRTLIDIVATYTVTDALSITLNYDYATQDDAVTVGQEAKWSGVAGYINYKISDQWRASLRAETFDDEDGFRTGIAGGQTWDEVTATLAYAPSKHVELRAEVRGDRSDKDVFLDENGTTAKDNQNSFGLQALYKL